ncbi:hypothetical protein [Croceimicrobium sp.]|uniref:hypothetical protein n=1 Tax=Croceimicrobium sp. TaxID=2828340 RepID=UPI003BAC8749
MKYLVPLLFLLCFSAKAQEKLRGDYLWFALGGSLDQFKDDYISPNTYRGLSGNVALGWHTYKGHWMNNLDISGLGGWQNPAAYPDQNSRTTSLGFRGHYSLRYRVHEKGKHQFLAGLYSQNIFILRTHNQYNNSAQSFSGFFGYGPSIAYTYSRTTRIFGRSWHWSWQSEWNIPFGTYILRPNYIRQYSGGEIADRGHHFWGDTWQTDFRHSLIWHRSNGNQIRLMYQWEYFQTERFNPSYNGGHLLSLQVFYKL